jgi:UDP-N-acetylmuramate dehydrogenase
VETRVLGGGANVLVRDDGVDGVVVRLDDPSFKQVRFDGEMLVAGGGADLMRLAHDSVRRGLTGLEYLAGIPGTVGGAIRTNAGGRYGSIGDVVSTVRLLTPTGMTETVAGTALDFGYRRSNVGRCLVLAAEFRLRQGDRRRVLERYQRILAEKRSSQPLGQRSAGCIFKNPPGESAGRLIDRAGLKGEAVGGAAVSRDHANFIVTRGGATAADVLALVERIRETVRAKHKIELELEIDIW